MRLTLDSTEPLEDAMRVLGALYGVRLVVANDDEAGRLDGRRTATPGLPNGGGKKKRRSTADAKPRAGSAPGSEDEASQRLVTSGDGSPSGNGADSGPPVSPSNQELRSWARDNGVAVSDRGRVPASVLAAYREAHSN